MNSKKITMLLTAIICMIFLASCDNKSNLKTDTSPSDTTAYEQTQSESTSSNQIEESESGVSSETSDSKDNIELVNPNTKRL